MKVPPLHDLVIKLIAEFCSCDNNTLVALMRVSKRFYNLRDFFFSHIYLDVIQSNYALEFRPYGWNKVLRLALVSKNIVDLSPFQSIHSMTLSDCSRITDLTPLKNLSGLDIEYCPNISDISPLKNVEMLSFVRCPKITDVSALSNTRFLSLINCPGISDVSALKNIHWLYISRCHNITDISSLTGVESLYFNDVKIR